MNIFHILHMIYCNIQNTNVISLYASQIKKNIEIQ